MKVKSNWKETWDKEISCGFLYFLKRVVCFVLIFLHSIVYIFLNLLYRFRKSRFKKQEQRSEIPICSGEYRVVKVKVVTCKGYPLRFSNLSPIQTLPSSMSLTRKCSFQFDLIAGNMSVPQQRLSTAHVFRV